MLKNTKTKLAVALLGLFLMPFGQAATVTVDVDWSFPDIIILYGYTDVDITMSAGALADFLEADATSGAVGVVNGQTLTISTLTAATTVTAATAEINTEVDVLPSDPTITIENMFGVRSIGVGSGYTATVVENTDASSIISSSAVSTPSDTGLTISYGNLSFDLDIAAVDTAIGADTGSTFSIATSWDITVTGD